MDREISAYLVRLRRDHPFLATLSLYMEYRFTREVPQFDTDGRIARIHPDYFARLDRDQRTGALLHLTLHSALLHPLRCGPRIPEIWNIATDLVVNAIIAESRFQPPPETAVEPRYAKLSAEQIYRKLLESGRQLASQLPSASTSPCGSEGGQEQQDGSQQADGNGNETTQGPEQQALLQTLQLLYPATRDLRISSGREHPEAKAEQARQETHWKQALTRAETVDRLTQKHRGDLPAGLLREIERIVEPKLDWRTLLWRFMARTPCDYSGYDRRFIHQGLYLDQLDGETLTVHIAIDTSGSVDEWELEQFRAETEAILRCYAGIKGLLYFVDAAVYGPYPVDRESRIEQAQGDGGTDFAVFFEQLEEQLPPFEQAICVYLTDGLGSFPARPPSLPVLWVVTAADERAFPFGEVALLET